MLHFKDFSGIFEHLVCFELFPITLHFKDRIQAFTRISKHNISFMIVYNYDADLEVSDTCVRSSLLS